MVAGGRRRDNFSQTAEAGSAKGVLDVHSVSFASILGLQPFNHNFVHFPRHVNFALHDYALLCRTPLYMIRC